MQIFRSGNIISREGLNHRSTFLGHPTPPYWLFMFRSSTLKILMLNLWFLNWENPKRSSKFVEVLEIMNYCFIKGTVNEKSKFWYSFDSVLYQFIETWTSERTLTGLNQLLKCSGFNLYPLSFFLYSPFNLTQKGGGGLKNKTFKRINETARKEVGWICLLFKKKT